jgi:hypothetical protein
VVFETSFFDRQAVLHEAHWLAYLNLERDRDKMRPFNRDHLRRAQEQRPRGSHVAGLGHAASRAKRLAEGSPVAKSIMEELGLWRF